MPSTASPETKEDLAAIAQKSRRLYAQRIAGAESAPPWWTAVIITASSQRQAERYLWEVRRREEQGKVPAGVTYLVTPDLQDKRIGAGGATINALRGLIVEDLFRNHGRAAASFAGTLADWWRTQRVLVIHSGGDSRRLPQYSLSGKLFSALPVKTPWGEVSTVFDEILALSTGWLERLPAGLVVGTGDVIPTFDSGALAWDQPGVCGVAMRQPAEAGAQHGVYATDEQGRVYAFLQNPSRAEVQAAGGLLEGGQVALDTGLLCFAPDAAARLTGLAGARESGGKLHLEASILEQDGPLPVIELNQHFTMTLTGQWSPGPEDGPALRQLATALEGLPFRCSVVSGDFTHIGTTSLFRELLTEQTEFSRLYMAQQRLGATTQSGLRSAGVVVDSVLSGGGELSPGAVAIECHLKGAVRAARGSVLHGLEGIAGDVEIPEDTVVHQIPVVLPDGRRGVVIRVYGVGDDPKAPAAAWKATWFGRPMIDELRNLGLDLGKVWPGLPAEEWTLWNARLFPVATVEEAWACARWLMRLANEFSADRWDRFERLSLATSTDCADTAANAAAHARRLQENWQTAAVTLAASGSDIRPLLAHAPGVNALVQAGRALCAQARRFEESSATEAASRYCHASLFFAQAGLEQDAGESRELAFRMVERAVAEGGYREEEAAARSWRRKEITVAAPARLDLGGGWSDTPPFCLDWGGTVLNVAVELNRQYPIRTAIRRLDEPVIRFYYGETSEEVAFREAAEILQPSRPGDPFSIPRTALQMTGLFRGEETLETTLARMGGGLEIRTEVNLPMGSGLGTSSILAATLLRAMSEMLGETLEDQELSSRVTRLEQLMTTGGGWQDQAGGIFPGAKLVTSGPGPRQRLRVQPVSWTAEREAEFEGLMVLYFTGIRRIARNLLQQVVASYLARETATVQVLHSIKTLAMEMAHAMREGEWDYLGQLLDRHWELNQILDPNTTNAPINALLHKVRPYIRGVKLAGAGGGGFLMLLAKSPEAACELRAALAGAPGGGSVYDWKIAKEGLRVHSR